MKKAFQLQQDATVPLQQFQHEEKTSLRVNKYLTACGFCSRRKADKLVEEGRVTIDGDVAVIGSQVREGQAVWVDGSPVSAAKSHVYIALNKPVGIVCTTERDKEGNIVDFMDHPQQIFPIGRLDKDSSGLILLTSDGDIVNKILRAENNHEKEYIVHVMRDITPDFIKKMAAGVEITNMRNKTRVVTKKCKVTRLAARRFRIVLTQGLNRQIRRMCTELGNSVASLRRERIMNITLDGLEVGQWRYLTQQELNVLNKTINT